MINIEKNHAKISKVFDCGSCLYPQINEEQMKEVMKSKEEMLNRVYEYPTSAIKYQGKKINYVEFLENNVYKECVEALNKISSKINMVKIKDIIENTSYITGIQKEFYTKIIEFRKQIIIDGLNKVI